MKALPLVVALGSLAAWAACATGTNQGQAGGGGAGGDSSVAVDAPGLGVPVLAHEAGARDAGHSIFTDGNNPGPGEAGRPDAFAGPDAPVHADAPVHLDAPGHLDAPAHDGAVHADAPTAMDAHRTDAPGPSDAHGGMDAGSVWGPVSVVQSSAESTSCTLGLTSPTRVGTLLVAMEPGSAPPPDGAGWTLLAGSSDGAQIFVWPDNPGGLQSFTVGSGLFGCDIIFVEFAGAPAAVVLDFQRVASTISDVPSITVTGSTPKAAGELELLYLTAGSTPSASVAGWHPLGTDGNTNFAWWQKATPAAPSATAVLGTPTSATIVLANLAD